MAHDLDLLATVCSSPDKMGFIFKHTLPCLNFLKTLWRVLSVTYIKTEQDCMYNLANLVRFIYSFVLFLSEKTFFLKHQVENKATRF